MAAIRSAMRFARFPRAAVASAAENFVLSGRRLGHTKAGEPAKLFSAAPPADAEAISHIAFGFMASKALFAALDVKLFAQLSGGRSLSSEELASELSGSVDEKQLETLTTALTSIGLLERDADGRLSNPPTVEAFLSGSNPAWDFGDYLRFQIDKQMYPFMNHLTETVKGQESTHRFHDYSEWMADPEEARLYTESQHAGSIGPAKTLAKRAPQLFQGGQRQVLDVGGGSGGFAITLAQKFPDLKATVLDFPNVCDVGRDYVAEAGMETQVDFLPGNALETPFPDSVDGVLMSYLSSSVGEQHLGPLYKRACEATNPGGFIVLHDFILDDDRAGPALTSLWALQHAVFTPGAISLTPARLSELLEAGGWSDIEFSTLIPGMTKICVGRKPQ